MAQYEMSLRDYQRIVLKRKRTIFACVLLVGVATLMFTRPPKVQYEALSKIRVARAAKPSGLYNEILMINEADARVFMQSEHTMVGTDAAVVVPGVGSPHPRCFGTYPRLLGKYVREEKLMPLERMVHRMTARVADQFNIRDRGRVAKGLAADLVVFDPATVMDRATWREGCQYSEGIEWVLVNGGVTVEQGASTGSGYGRALRRS